MGSQFPAVRGLKGRTTDLNIWMIHRCVRPSWARLQSGCVRILSQPSYPNAISTSAAIGKLAKACATPLHSFWADELSLLDRDVLDPDFVHGPKQLTDLYLLALAVKQGGRLLGFDRKIPLLAVKGAQPEHLQIL